MFNKSFLSFVFLHISVPAVCVAFYYANPLWLLSGLLFAVATIRTLRETKSLTVVAILCLLSGAAFALTLMLGTCFYMQGEGFNDAFFYHLNSGSLVIAARSYGSVFYPSLLGLFLAFVAPGIIYRTRLQTLWSRIPLLLLWLLALAGSYPVYSLVAYQMGLGDEMDLAFPIAEDAIPEITPQPITTADTPPPPVIVKPQVSPGVESEPKADLKKNIILIYAESLEELYFDTGLFGDLLPDIRDLSKNAHRFTNLAQVKGTGWTIGGIVASQCGFPLLISHHLAANSTMASVEKPYENEVCLADILSDNGYKTVYMGGAPLWFAGKGNFLRTHGYQQLSGYEELAPLLPDQNYRSSWGVYDDSLFDLALVELQSLEKESEPYFLTLLTLDTHHPDGLPSKSCQKLVNNKDPISNAIYCSDQLISNFIQKAMNVVDMKDTIIVLFSDHLSLRNTLWSKLRENRKRRRLTFMIFDDAPGTTSDSRATHFDVAPTVLDAAGITEHVKIGAGLSLFTQDSEQRGNLNLAQEPANAPSLINSSVSIFESGVSLSRQDLSLKIGDLTLKANNSGQKFSYGMYLAIFDEQGHVVDAIFSEDYLDLANNFNGTFVVGISLSAAPPYSALYFHGVLSPDGKGMSQYDFHHDVHLNALDIWGLREGE